MRMELEATPENVMRAVEALEGFAREQKLPEKAVHGLALALEECGSNIVNHALKRDAERKFCVALERKGSQILIELRDSGPEFDFTAFEGPKAPARDEDAPGGWGIQIVRRYTDAVRYRREGNENVLLLMKRIEEPASSNSNF
jgi:serine/threonine-protein kinase RsbW